MRARAASFPRCARAAARRSFAAPPLKNARARVSPAQGTRFIGVRREHLIVDYLEQYATGWPLFLVLVSAVQIASAVWWCARRDNEPGIMEAEHPQCGPPHFKYQLVGEFPGCEDQRYEAWRLLAYQFVHAGYAHLAANVSLQLLFGLPIELVHGPLRVAATYVAGVAAGGLACAVFDPYSTVLGASGGVCVRAFSRPARSPLAPSRCGGFVKT